MKLRIIQIILIVAVIVGAFFAGQETVVMNSGLQPNQANNNNITDANTPLVFYPLHMTAMDSNGNVFFDDTNSFADGTPALVAMQQMATIEYTQYVYGAMIISINGIKAGDHQYWALYSDGNYSSIGISAVVINKPTNLEWKIESY